MIIAVHYGGISFCISAEIILRICGKGLFSTTGVSDSVLTVTAGMGTSAIRCSVVCGMLHYKKRGLELLDT